MICADTIIPFPPRDAFKRGTVVAKVDEWPPAVVNNGALSRGEL